MLSARSLVDAGVLAWADFLAAWHGIGLAVEHAAELDALTDREAEIADGIAADLANDEAA